MSTSVQLIGLDWGTSSLRAYLYDADGKVVASRQHAWGIRQLPEGGFPAALRAITEDWPPCPIVAAGMVGSRQGWCEVPYVAVPANAAALAHGMLRVDACTSHALWIVPGLHRDMPADVMRGEETQIVGAWTVRPQLATCARFVLPGTHSKWVAVMDSRIVAFDTMMTGEIFALLTKHSILGTDATGECKSRLSDESFLRGIQSVMESGAAGGYSRLFSARALMLSGKLEPGDIPDFLSGLLIGEEFRIASLRDDENSAPPLCLIGEPSLCQRYVIAATYFGYAPATIVPDAAAYGLWQLASAAGLLAQATTYVFSGVDA